ncbi:MAG: hypothetical protein M1816_002428 [Peltula sp. TS41687]|nr:MAG: hypothetical protein M1816_002428 [Peltula sp. TS41687]
MQYLLTLVALLLCGTFSPIVIQAAPTDHKINAVSLPRAQVPGGFPFPIPKGRTLPDWDLATKMIARDRMFKYPEVRKRFFDPKNIEHILVRKEFLKRYPNVDDLDHPEARTEFLKRFPSARDYIRQVQRRRIPLKEPIPSSLKLRLREELDDVYFYCVKDAMYVSQQHGDFDVMMKQCEDEFTVKLDGQEDIEPQLGEKSQERLQAEVDRRYDECFNRGLSGEECMKRWTKTIEGKTYTPRRDVQWELHLSSDNDNVFETSLSAAKDNAFKLLGSFGGAIRRVGVSGGSALGQPHFQAGFSSPTVLSP